MDVLGWNWLGRVSWSSSYFKLKRSPHSNQKGMQKLEFFEKKDSISFKSRMQLRKNYSNFFKFIHWIWWQWIESREKKMNWFDCLFQDSVSLCVFQWSISLFTSFIHSHTHYCIIRIADQFQYNFSFAFSTHFTDIHVCCVQIAGKISPKIGPTFSFIIFPKSKDEI